MIDEILRRALIVFVCLGVVIKFAELVSESENHDQTLEITNAKPIYQQPIGDEAEPDLLIIYEAEVDGMKVYPSVIKEAE